MEKNRPKHTKTQKKVENDERWKKTDQNTPKRTKAQKISKKVKNEKKTTKTHQNTTKS